MEAPAKQILRQAIISLILLFVFVATPLFSLATFSNSNNIDATTQNTSFFSINPDDIFMKIRGFLTITPRKGTTTGLSIDIAVNKTEINKTESWFQTTRDYIINYVEIVNKNIQQKTGVDVLSIFTFFWNNLYNMFATTFGLIKSVLP